MKTLTTSNPKGALSRLKHFGSNNRLFQLFKRELYWKERVIGALGLGMYVFGNLIEFVSGKLTSDPPAIWMTGIVLSAAVIYASVSKKFEKYTHTLFKLLVYLVNFNIILAYGDSTDGPVDVESFYLFGTYAILIVTTQMFDSRKELISATLYELGVFAVVLYLNRQNDPILFQPIQLLMFSCVVGGNYIIGIQRMRLTQISGGSTIQFKSISESARDIQSIINHEFDFLYINPSVTEITGYAPGDLNGKKFITLVEEEDRASVTGALDTIKLSSGEKQSVEYRIKAASGNPVWVESIFSNFNQGPNSKDHLIFAETRDIEVRKQLEQEIKQQLLIEEMLIKYSNRFINVERTEIESCISGALGDFGKMLSADAALVYRMHGKLNDEFRSTNQWFADDGEALKNNFDLSVSISQPLLAFLRSLRGEKSAHGNFYEARHLFEIQALKVQQVEEKKFYIIPLQSGHIVNGFVAFVFDEKIKHKQFSFFGLIGNMVANAFTRQRAEIRLHEAQMTNESILKALPDWLYIVNNNGEFSGTNNHSTLPDYIPDYGLIGKTFADVLPGSVAAMFKQAMEEVRESDMASSFEYQDTAIHKGRYFKVIIAPFKAKEFLIIIRDVTELRLAQDELLSKAKKLERSNKELEEFAYIVSHDMKQPIKTIISYLTLLKKKHVAQLKPEAQEFVNFSIDGANKMSDLIRDILQYSKMEQQINMSSNISLDDMVKKVCKGLHDTITINKAEVLIDVLPTVTCNETMISELFQNLIENGIKYNRSEQKKVTVNVRDKETEWLFRIADNGIGFEQEYAQQIFKIFKRLHTDDEFQGTGIGLSICQKVIEKHGGKIWAESEKGKGSTFYFTLPKN